MIGDSLDKAAANTATRPIPKSAGAQIRFLVKHEKGSTRIVAQRLGISQRTVERYLKGQIKTALHNVGCSWGPKCAGAPRQGSAPARCWRRRV
ncbi:XRE family transcriptional regulator, partial [Streptomyces sp. NPDC005065]